MTKTKESPTTQKKHKNDEVQVTVHHKPFCKVELEVFALPPLLKEAKRKAVKDVNKEVEMPGFRKGKAPESYILKNYSGAVDQKFQKILADVSFLSAQKLAKVPLLNQNSKITFDLKKHSDEGAELLFTFETEPNIPIVDPKKFKPKKVDAPKVGKKELDEAIRQMQFFHAEWEEIKDRPIKKGDYILLDLMSLEQDPPQKVFSGTRFEVSEKGMAEWMRELVIGMKTGDQKESVSRPDKKVSEKEKKQYEPRKVRVTILKIESAILPEINDAFAQKIGSKTVDEMKESIQKMLEKQAEEKVKQQMGEQVNEFLLTEYSFELPKSLTETEFNHRKKQMMQDPQTKVAYEKLSKEAKQKKDEEILSQCTHAVQLFYLSRKVVQDANISVTNNMIQQEALRSMQSYGMQPDPQNIPREVFALALSKVILAKTQEYIIENASNQKSKATKKTTATE